MRRMPALLILASLGLVLFHGTATARDGFFPGGRTSFRPFHGIGGGHRPSRLRGWPIYPGYLQTRSEDVNVIIEQTFVSVPAAPAVPSVLDLPVSAGIREALPAQPAVIVVNERSGVGETGRGQVLSGGPKIIKARPESGDTQPATGTSSGVRIVHLAVPVGR
jgi:hypothetical protein